MSTLPYSLEDANYAIRPAIKPAAPPIATGISHSADKKTISFLDLPSELRNVIYEYTLVFSDAFLVASNRLYRYHGSCNRGLALVEGTHESLQRRALEAMNVDIRFIAKQVGDKNDLRPHDLVQVAHPGLDIFLVCRQVYQEAASAFFAQNAFAISRLACKDSVDLNYRHDSRGFFFAEGADWLGSLGSQFSRLKRVILDTDAICYGELEGRHSIYDFGAPGKHFVELLPLLRVLWSRDWAGELEFTSGSQLRYPIDTRNHGGSNVEEVSRFHADRLTKMLGALRRDDLGLQTGARTMCHLGVHRDGHCGFVLFRSTHSYPCLPDRNYGNLRRMSSADKGLYHPCLEQHISFVMDKDDGTCRRIKRPVSLTHLPKRFQDSIIQHILYRNEMICVDLNDEKDRVPGYVYLNRSRYTSGIRQYYTINEFALQISFAADPTHVYNLYALHRWLTRHCLPDISPIDMAHLKGRGVRRISLDFEDSTGQVNSLDQLSINIASLLEYAACLGDYSVLNQEMIHITLWHTNKQSGRTLIEKKSIVLYKLRAAVVHAGREADIDTGSLEMVINGNGVLIGYMSADSTKVHEIATLRDM